MRLVLVALALAPLPWICFIYPIAPWALALALAAYGVLLWHWPALFLVLVPALLPSFDLGIWTGWLSLQEIDLLVLLTLAILVWRTPPALCDMVPPFWICVVLSATVLFGIINVGLGLIFPFNQGEQSQNPLLRPDNALRLAKGMAEALALLPFIRLQQRTRTNALPLFAGGIVAGLCIVATEVVVERALFSGILDFTSDYRVAGPFSSMRFGGGHIGAYVALALPFLAACRLAGNAVTNTILLMLATVAGTYTLVVTFARTGYVAALVGVGIAGSAWLYANRHARIDRPRAVWPVFLGICVAGAMGFAASSPVMRQRIAAIAEDLSIREGNWQRGWAQRDSNVFGLFFGTGLGTYQRIMRTQATADRPSDIAIRQDAEGRYAALNVASAFFLGQKIAMPRSGDARLSLEFRSDDSSALGISLCDKLLLYSDRCRGTNIAPDGSGRWQHVDTIFPTEGLGQSALAGLVHRPVELSLFVANNGNAIGIRNIALTDGAGSPLIVNGDFAHGLDRWLLTDDTHVAWRILNQYLMLLFESGISGLAVYLALVGTAIAGGFKAIQHGNPMGAAVLGSVASFLVSGLFDNVLEAPRIATLFFMICWAGMLLWEDRYSPKAAPPP